METTIQAPFNGTIKQVTVVNGDAIATGTYLLKLKNRLKSKFILKIS